MEVRIAGQRLNVPVYGSEERTKQLAEELEIHIREIEEESDRIDSHAFALQAALHYISRYREEEETRGAETRDIRKLHVEEFRKETEAQTSETAEIVRRLSDFADALQTVVDHLPEDESSPEKD